MPPQDDLGIVLPEQKEINELNEQEFLTKVKEKNSKKLVKLNLLQREIVGQHIADLFTDEAPHHKEVSDRVDEWDDVWHMVRNARPGDDADTPNYRTPLSTVMLEVIHANVMNVFFSPKDIVRVLPTEEGDIPKVEKLDTFANWSVKHELEIEENFDRLSHASGKNGESPYIVSWAKEYGTELEITPVMNPANPDEPLMDDIGEVVTQEREVPKLLYNGPRLTVFSRKDYFVPKSATADKIPPWEGRRINLTADEVMRREREGKFYNGVFAEIGGWGIVEMPQEDAKLDTDGNPIPLAKTEKEFREFYGRLRIQTLKEDKGQTTGDEQYEELEDEFIGIFELKSATLCSLKKNRFPLKMRPIKLDLFIPDDGRLKGIGVIEFLDSMQKSADALHNQYLFGTIQANNPTIWFTPTGNRRNEPFKIKAGFAYPTSDPRSMSIFKIPPPDVSLLAMIERVENQAQVMFGVSNFAAGVESTIDPTGPAKKAEIVVAQGNVRMNAIIKRRLRTLKDILKKWFLLYQANMPPNKFMRITGAGKGEPVWEFRKIAMTDFALNAIPDFEFTGNILNANKTLEINKKLAIYRLMITNPFFSPQTQQGMQSLHAITKWLLDGLDEIGISAFLPAVPADIVQTPEEENARFLQGDIGEPTEREDHISHIRSHSEFIMRPGLPDEVVEITREHIGKHVDMLKSLITRQTVMSGLPQPQPVMPVGGVSGRTVAGATAAGVPREAAGVSQQVAGVG